MARGISYNVGTGWLPSVWLLQCQQVTWGMFGSYTLCKKARNQVLNVITYVVSRNKFEYISWYNPTACFAFSFYIHYIFNSGTNPAMPVLQVFNHACKPLRTSYMCMSQIYPFFILLRRQNFIPSISIGDLSREFWFMPQSSSAN